MKSILSLASCVWLLGSTSCAPKAIIVEPLTPAVVKVRAQVQAAAVTATRVHTGGITVHAQSQTLAATAGRLALESARLRELPGVPPGEFEALWVLTHDLQRQTFAHEIQARDTATAAAELERIHVEASQSMADLESAATASDQGVETLKAQVIRQADNAALGKAVKSVVILLVILAVAALIIWGFSRARLI